MTGVVAVERSKEGKESSGGAGEEGGRPRGLTGQTSGDQQVPAAALLPSLLSSFLLLDSPSLTRLPDSGLQVSRSSDAKQHLDGETRAQVAATLLSLACSLVRRFPTGASPSLVPRVCSLALAAQARPSPRLAARSRAEGRRDESSLNESEKQDGTATDADRIFADSALRLPDSGSAPLSHSVTRLPALTMHPRADGTSRSEGSRAADPESRAKRWRRRRERSGGEAGGLS